MNFPDDILMIIKEFSMPCSRPDWRQGCLINRFYNDYSHSFNTIIRRKYKQKLHRRIALNFEFYNFIYF